MLYSFTTYWSVAAPVSTVWPVIFDALNYPSWWKYVKKVTLTRRGDANGLGSVQHHEWATALPYRLVFDIESTIIEPPHVLQGNSAGELVGVGRWELTQDGANTIVRYDWNVSTTKAWMNSLAPLLRPFFAWNHKVVMDEGGRGLARRLNTALTAAPRHVINISAA